MDLRVLVTGIAGLLVLVWCLARVFRESLARSSQSVPKYSDAGICKNILACKCYDGTGAKNRYTNVESRAIPNKRLVHIFGIDNSFTTSDSERRIEFNRTAKQAIEMTEVEWREVAVSANELVRQALTPFESPTAGPPEPITLDALVRSVCLKIILHVLFKTDPLESDNKNISALTESINSLWIQSKGKGRPSQLDQRNLQEALAKEIPEKETSCGNPLNLIIPAYETLWRVVLSGFLEVTFVGGGSPYLRSVLAHFLASPTIATRGEIAHDPEVSAVSVEHIVKEALRLYPSVKRVYRRLNMNNKPGPEDIAADIEACQRQQVLWGEDAERFVPSRWINASKEAQSSYLAFGHRPFECPAKTEFGPMMIGILVAAFTHHVPCEDWSVYLGEGSSDVDKRNFSKALSGEHPLVSDRSTYDGIRIVRK